MKIHDISQTVFSRNNDTVQSVIETWITLTEQSGWKQLVDYIH